MDITEEEKYTHPLYNYVEDMEFVIGTYYEKEETCVLAMIAYELNRLNNNLENNKGNK